MYVDLAGLARYKSDFGAWARGALLPKDAAAARVRTAKAGAVSFVPVQETPLDVSVDFMFTETPPASGDKSPSNPSTITGATQVKVTRCGDNLLIYPYIETSHTYQSGLVIETGVDGSVIFNGASPSGGTTYFSVTDGSSSANSNNPSSMILSVGETYTASLVISSGTIASVTDLRLMIVDHDAGEVVAAVPAGSSVTFTATSPHIRARIEIKRDITFSNVTVLPQLEIGSIATSFKPYYGTDYTLPLGGTYYGGTLDVATGAMTVTWGARVFTGQETSFTWGVVTTEAYTQFYTSSQNLYPGRKFGSGATAYCSHFNRLNNSSVHTSIGYGLYGTTYGGYFYYLSSYTTVDDWTIFLASEYANGTPVTVVYQLATPQIVQLTPTEILSLTQSSVYDPRVNTVYSDQSAVQVGYLKHPSAASADLRNALVSLGGGV